MPGPPALAERLLTNWYAYDQRIHGELKQRSEAELLSNPAVGQMKQLNGKYSEIELVRKDSTHANDNQLAGRSIKLDDHDWDQTVQRLAVTFDRSGSNRVNARRCSHGAASPWSQQQQNQSTSTQRGGYNSSVQTKNAGAEGYERIPTETLSPLQEDESRYYVTAVIKKTNDRLKLATVSWLKQPLQSWLTRAENQFSTATAVLSGNYTLPQY